jgi:hypothetical protein
VHKKYCLTVGNLGSYTYEPKSRRDCPLRMRIWQEAAFQITQDTEICHLDLCSERVVVENAGSWLTRLKGSFSNLSACLFESGQIQGIREE